MSDFTSPPPPPPPPPGGAYGGSGGMSGGTPAYAELGPRIIAFLIDVVAIPIAAWIAIAIISFVLGALSDALGALVFLVGWVGIIGYQYFYVPYLEGTTGQTIGKRSQNIKTVSAETGHPVGFGMAFARYLLNGIVCGLGWLLPFFDAQKQTLGDKVTKGITIPA